MQGRTFRGQSPDGTWHEGFLIRSPGVKNSRPGEGWYINSEQEPAYAHLVKPFTIGMNTTLTDGNGAPVFEGDILKDNRCGKDVIFCRKIRRIHRLRRRPYRILRRIFGEPKGVCRAWSCKLGSDLKGGWKCSGHAGADGHEHWKGVVT